MVSLGALRRFEVWLDSSDLNGTDRGVLAFNLVKEGLRKKEAAQTLSPCWLGCAW